mmetsp:Transcript_5928/g.10521  ORF Transcript_5928/g.10521 Transcript_5928/m.10521 type:complete len:150 (-) Transcript_5928:652-1101(-)
MRDANCVDLLYLKCMHYLKLCITVDRSIGLVLSWISTGNDLPFNCCTKISEYSETNQGVHCVIQHNADNVVWRKHGDDISERRNVLMAFHLMIDAEPKTACESFKSRRLQCNTLCLVDVRGAELCKTQFDWLIFDIMHFHWVTYRILIG